jgi:hypothetical protein
MYNECRHVKPSGEKCQSPALRNMPYCYFHARANRKPPRKLTGEEEPLEIPLLEDHWAVQIALSQVLARIADSTLDARRAGLMLYGLQIAAQVASQRPRLFTSDSVRSITTTIDGEDIGPVKTARD